MVDTELMEKAKLLLAEEFEVEDVESMQMDANVIETLDLDSLDFVDLVVIIEANFGFKVEREDLKTIVTFQDLYNYLSEKTSKV